MSTYLARRLLQVVPVLLLASLAVWGIAYMLPGNPADALAGQYATPIQLRAIDQRLGLSRPLVVQYFIWLGHAVQGNLGTSFQSGQPVLSELLQRIPATVQLTLCALIIGILVTLPLAVATAIHPNGAIAKLVRLYQAASLAVPAFWLGLLLVLLLSVKFHVLPSVSSYVPMWDNPLLALRDILLPAVTLGVNISAVLIRYVRSSLDEAMRRNFVRTARAKGLQERDVIIKHVLRNALIPMVTVIGIILPLFLGGTAVIEVVFNYPGLGSLIYNAAVFKDYAVVQGGVIFIVFVFLVLSIAFDFLYTVLDPRIRLR